jgi:hypothetical protein
MWTPGITTTLLWHIQTSLSQSNWGSIRSSMYSYWDEMLQILSYLMGSPRPVNVWEDNGLCKIEGYSNIDRVGYSIDGKSTSYCSSLELIWDLEWLRNKTYNEGRCIIWILSNGPNFFRMIMGISFILNFLVEGCIIYTSAPANLSEQPSSPHAKHWCLLYLQFLQ